MAGILLVGFNNAADLRHRRAVPAAVGGRGGDRRHVDLRRLGGYAGTILGALILTVLDSLLTILNACQAMRQILYG